MKTASPVYYLYVIAPSNEGPVKIGISHDPYRRLKQLQTGHHQPLFVHQTFKISGSIKDARRIEKLVHTNISFKRTSGEWFRIAVEDAIVECHFGLMSN